MEDVYISDPRKSSAQVIAKKNKEQKESLKRRNLRHFLFDLIVKSLICTCIMAINFTMFAEAGSYNLFDSMQMPTTESLYVYAGIAAVCFVIMLLFSFSAFIQNIIIAVVFGIFVLAFLNQFALFDSDSILYGLFSSYLSADMSDLFMRHSSWIIAGTITLISLIIISNLSRKKQFYLWCFLLIILGAAISEAYLNPYTHNYEEKKSLSPKSEVKEQRNFIFIALPEFVSFADLNSIPNKTFSINQVTENMLGFYTSNNFTYYPNAYVGKYHNPYINLLASLNPNKEKIEESLLDNAILSSYWSFKNLNTKKMYIRDNELYQKLISQSYNIKVYQSKDIELCNVDNKLIANKCIEKINSPINLSNTNFSTLDKTVLLSAQWLESTGIVPNINLPLLAASYLTNTVAPLNFSTTELQTINSFKFLDLIIDDMKTSKGNNAYFVALDMPSSTYTYDDFCQLKSPYQWHGAKHQPWVKNRNINAKQQAYAEQTNCLLGQLENFIKNIKNADKLDKTTIIIQGINSSSIFMNRTENLKEYSRVGMAILKPDAKASEIHYNLCSVPDIINEHISKKACRELADKKITDKKRKEILKEAHKPIVSEQQTSNAVIKFKEWYNVFASRNKFDNHVKDFTAESASEQPQIPLETKEVAKISVSEVVDDLPLEPEVKSISAAIAETAAEDAKEEIEQQIKPEKDIKKEDIKEKDAEIQKAAKQQSQKEDTSVKTQVAKTPSVKIEIKIKENNQDTSIPLTKPEMLKRAYRAKLKEKAKAEAVFQNEQSLENLDVVPPALLGETQYQPTE